MIKLMAATTYVDQRTMRKIRSHGLGFGGAGAAIRLPLDCVGAESMEQPPAFASFGQDGHYGNARLLRRLRQENEQTGAAKRARRGRVETKGMLCRLQL